MKLFLGLISYYLEIPKIDHCELPRARGLGNIVNDDLKNANWKNKKSGKILSRKRAPKTMRAFAQLNKHEQSHIISQIFERLLLA